MRSDNYPDEVYGHVTVGLCLFHMGKHGLLGNVDMRRLGCRPRLHPLDIREECNHPPRGSVAAAGPEVTGVELTPGRFLQSIPVKVELLNGLHEEPGELLLEVWGAFSVSLSSAKRTGEKGDGRG